jgi:hypothetical protein
VVSRYRLTYRRKLVEEFVLHIFSETLDEEDVGEKILDLWEEHGSEISEVHDQEYSGLTISNGHYDRSSLSELKLIGLEKT